jgi:hypothetical protein
MSFIAFLVAFVLFLVNALASEYDWNLHGHNYLAWGLVFLSLGFLLPGAIASYRSRRIVNE